MNCRKNKHSVLIREYRTLIEEQAQLIKQQQEEIKKLKRNLESLTEASKLNDEFINYLIFM